MTKTFFINATWEKEITLGTELLDYYKNNNIKKIALFASVQFLNFVYAQQQLTNAGITVLITKAKRAHKEGQVLGCDAYHDSFDKDIISEADALLYIGDGMFHPKALLLAQMYTTGIKPVTIWNPVEEKMYLITKEDIQKQINKTRANLKRYLAAQTIGILVTLKPGQSYLQLAQRLKQQLASGGKQVYIFIDDTISYNHLENYPFIQAWVNTACPRIGMDDIVDIPQPLINIREALDPVRALEQLH